MEQVGSLDPVIAKFQHAGDHLQRLDREINDWLVGDSYTFVIEPEGPSREHRVYPRFKVRPNVVRWGLLFTDGVHNLRSTLDHLAYQLAIRATGTDPPKDAGRLAFPIASSLRSWTAQAERIAVLSTPMRTFIEESQPCHTHPNDPKRAPLAMLRAFDDTTKHREIQPIGTGAGGGEVKVETADGSPALYSAEFGPLDENTSLAIVTAPSDFEMDVRGSRLQVMLVHPLIPALRTYPSMMAGLLIEGVADVIGRAGQFF